MVVFGNEHRKTVILTFDNLIEFKVHSFYQ